MAMGVHGCRTRTGVAMPVREVRFMNPRPGGTLEPAEKLRRHVGLYTGVRNFLYRSCTAESAWLLSGRVTGSPLSADRSAASHSD